MKEMVGVENAEVKVYGGKVKGSAQEAGVTYPGFRGYPVWTLAVGLCPSEGPLESILVAGLLSHVQTDGKLGQHWGPRVQVFFPPGSSNPLLALGYQRKKQKIMGFRAAKAR